MVITELEETLIALFLYAVMDEYDAARSPGNDMLGYPGYLRKAEDYLVAHLDEPVSLADLAEVAGIGARTLSKAFHWRHGVGPLGFLKARRLDAAHRALLAADPKSTTVTDVAMRFGFGHLGRFSADYRQVFQEAPSETLRR